LRLKILEKLRTASFNSKFTGSYKICIYFTYVLDYVQAKGINIVNKEGFGF